MKKRYLLSLITGYFLCKEEKKVKVETEVKDKK
jgi:hypothetical protein